MTRAATSGEAVRYFRLYLENSEGESEAGIRKARAELERADQGILTGRLARRTKASICLPSAGGILGVAKRGLEPLRAFKAH